MQESEHMAGKTERPLGAYVRELARDWTIELTPREVGTLGGAVRDHLPAGTRAYVTWLAGSDFANSVAAAATLRRAGLEPVPHLAARAIADKAALDDILARLRGEAGVEQILLIGGSLKRPVGAFDACVQLLETGLFEHHGVRRVDVAAHPEGAPDIPPPAVAEALRQKNDYAARSGMTLELITQFCFDAAPVVAWEHEVRTDGNRLPIAVGLAGLANVTTLLKHARNCGVGNSIGILFKRASMVFQLASAVEPSDVVLRLAEARRADPTSALRRLHFFPFGAFAATARYARALAAGEFDIDAGDKRLRVHV